MSSIHVITGIGGFIALLFLRAIGKIAEIFLLLVAVMMVAVLGTVGFFLTGTVIGSIIGIPMMIFAAIITAKIIRH